MYFPQDEQIRDAEIAQGLAELEYKQYADLAEHENNMRDIELSIEEDKRLSYIAKDLLKDFYYCTRDWSAWQHKTMSEDDFIVCFDNEDIVSDTFSTIRKIETEAKKEESEKVAKLQESLVGICEFMGWMEKGRYTSDLNIDEIKKVFTVLKETGYKTPIISSKDEIPF